MPILKLFSNRINEIKKKKLEKTAYLPDNAVVCGIARLELEGKYLKIVKDSDAICMPVVNQVIDLLKINNCFYDIYKSYEEIKKAYETEKLHSGERFCYSKYDCNEIFPDLKYKQTKEDIMEYLKEYNRANNTTLYWSFLDEEEKEELNKIADTNAKRYTNLHY